MTWTVTAVPTESVKEFWPTVAPLLAPAVEQSGGRVTMATLLAGLLEQRYVLWATYPESKIVKAAFITRIAQYPARKMLAVDCAGGHEMGGWVADVQDTFRRYANAAGCSGVEMYGRPGWLRVLGRYGWFQPGVLMEASIASDGEPR